MTKKITDAIASDNLETIRVLNVLLDELETLLTRNKSNLKEAEDAIKLAQEQGENVLLEQLRTNHSNTLEIIKEILEEIDDTKKHIERLKQESLGLASMSWNEGE